MADAKQPAFLSVGLFEADSLRTDRTPNSPLSSVVRRFSMYSASSSACSSAGSSTGGGGPGASLAWVTGGAFSGRGRLPREGSARRGGDEGNAEALHAEATRERGRSFGLCLVGRLLAAWSAAAGLMVAVATGMGMAAEG